MYFKFRLLVVTIFLLSISCFSKGQQDDEDAGDIVINSLEDQPSNRHHYDPTAEPNEKKQEERAKPIKPEARLETDIDHSASDPAIIDHRPSTYSETTNVIDETTPTSTQSPQLTTTSSPNIITINAIPITTPSPVQAQTSSSSYVTGHVQSSQLSNGQQPQIVGSWQQSSSSAQNNQLGQSLLPTSSNQMMTVQSQSTGIAGDQAQSQQIGVQSSAGGVNQPIGTVQMASSQAPMVLSVNQANGQQVTGSMVPASNYGARRISLTGWLRNISSMLANIFNRREHGPSQLLLGGGPWIQLNPSSPHWLAQAQTFIQNQQQMQQQLLGSSNQPPRIFVPTQVSQSNQQAPSHVSIQPFTSSQSQVQQQVDLQTGSSSPSVSYVVSGQQQPQIASQYQIGSNSNLQSQSTQIRSQGKQASRAHQTGRPISLNPTHQNLPLAHYSRYQVAEKS